MIRRLATVAIVAALLYLVIVAAFAVGQRWMIFPAPRRSRPPPALGTLVRGDGFLALDVPVASSRGTVALFHGNGEDLADATPMIGFWRAEDFSVFAVEYPGYGVARDLGRPSADALVTSAEKALRWLAAQGRPGALVLQGHSLGTCVAVEMARRGFGQQVVLLSPLTSVADMAHHYVPWVPMRYFLRDRFDTAAIAPQVQQPVLIVHGTADRVVPVEMGIRLSNLFPNVQLRLIRGAGHNDLLSAHSDALRKALATVARR